MHCAFRSVLSLEEFCFLREKSRLYLAIIYLDAAYTITALCAVFSTCLVVIKNQQTGCIIIDQGLKIPPQTSDLQNNLMVNG